MASTYQQAPHYVTQAHSAAASAAEKVSLPSLKSLNFQYGSPQSQESPPPQSGPSPSEHVPAPPVYAGRHDSASWGRGPPPPPQPQGHYAQAMPPPSKPAVKSSKQPVYRSENYARPEQPGHKPNGTWSAPPSTFQAPSAPAPSSSADAASQAPLKRGRTDSTLSASPGRSPHQTTYPAYGSQPHTPSPMYQVSNSATPPSEGIQQPSPFTQAGPGGYAYPPQHSSRGPYASHQAHTQPQQHQPPHGAPHPHPLPQQHPGPQQQQHPPPQQQQHQPQSQPQQHQQQVSGGNPYSQHQQQQQPPQHWQSAAGAAPAQQAQTAPSHMQNFVQTRPIVPANIDPRAAPQPPPAPPPAAAPPPEDREAHQALINEIIRHCSSLLNFANKYVSTNLQPEPEELRNMSQNASQVVQLLEEFRKLMSSGEQNVRDVAAAAPAVDEHRPPKRPWEDIDQDNQATPSDADIRYDENSQSTAEQDMEIIRSKRATSSTGTTPGQTKSKYRKRSRATPPGKCHSCNIRETPEWRRGPDGARTLCNACGLHYAKLMRKREKTLGADGKPVPIDLQTLRASTLASKEHGKGHHHDPSRQATSGPPAQQADELRSGAATPSAYEPSKPQMPPQPHSSQGSYQPPVSAQGAPPTAPSPHQLMHPPPLQPHSQPQQAMPPPPHSPWMTSPTSARGFSTSDPPYMRQPHSTAAHARGSPQ